MNFHANIWLDNIYSSPEFHWLQVKVAFLSSKSYLFKLLMLLSRIRVLGNKFSAFVLICLLIPNLRLNLVCGPSQRACDDTYCIQNDHWCDGVINCPMGQDEGDAACNPGQILIHKLNPIPSSLVGTLKQWMA